VHHQAASLYDLFNAREPRICKGLGLLINGQIQAGIRKTALTIEMVTDQVWRIRFQYALDLSVKCHGMLFMSKLMNGLIRYHSIEPVKVSGPFRILEIPLVESCSI